MKRDSYDRKPQSGSALRLAHALKIAGVRSCRIAYARAGHRGEFRHLQRHQRRSSSTIALSHPDQLVLLYERNVVATGSRNPVSLGNFLDWRRKAAASRRWPPSVRMRSTWAAKV